MRVDDRLSSIELLEDWSKRRIAQPRVAVAGEQADAVGLSVSNAYAISCRLPGTSGSGSTAKRPKRPLWSDTIRAAANSFISRASFRASCTSPNQTPGAVMDSMAVAIPTRSSSSTARAGEYPFHAARPGTGEVALFFAFNVA